MIESLNNDMIIFLKNQYLISIFAYHITYHKCHKFFFYYKLIMVTYEVPYINIALTIL